MARLITSEQSYSIENNILKKLKKSLPNLYLGEDSVVRILSEAIASEISLLNEEAKNIYSSNQLSNATGEFLDQIAFQKYGITRYSETYAESSSNERNVYFYSNYGTLGELNNGQGFVIPNGTIISNKIDTDNAAIQFVLTKDVQVLADDPFVFASVRAVNAGSSYNVDTNTLVYHNFGEYSDYLNGSLLVENRLPIINGSEEESDNNFKFRLTNYLSSSVNKNYDYLLMQSLSLPGIYDVSIIPSYYGIGTTGVILFGAGRESNKNINDLIDIRISEAKTPGQNIIVSQGIEVYLDMDVKIYYDKTINDLNLEKIRKNILIQIKQLIKEKEQSKGISFNEISNLIKNNFTSKEFKGFGTKDNSIFENIFVRKSDKYNEFPEERKSLENVYLNVADDERVRFGVINIIMEEDNR